MIHRSPSLLQIASRSLLRPSSKNAALRQSHRGDGERSAVAHAAAAAAAAATTGVPAEPPARARQQPLPRESSLAPPIVPAACAQSVLEASLPCARDVLETLVFKAVRLSADCCRVLAGVGEECVAAVLSGGSFGPALLPVVNGICGLVASIG